MKTSFAQIQSWLSSTSVDFAAQARVALGCRRADYNGSRPHSQLGWKTPSKFAFTFHPRQPPSLTPPDRAIQTPEANLRLDKTWGKVKGTFRANQIGPLPKLSRLTLPHNELTSIF
jgi:putative transposase